MSKEKLLKTVLSLDFGLEDQLGQAMFGCRERVQREGAGVGLYGLVPIGVSLLRGSQERRFSLTPPLV